MQIYYANYTQCLGLRHQTPYIYSIRKLAFPPSSFYWIRPCRGNNMPVVSGTRHVSFLAFVKNYSEKARGFPILAKHTMLMYIKYTKIQKHNKVKTASW